MTSRKILWQPPPNSINKTQISCFAELVKNETGFEWDQDFQKFWQWSIESNSDFWSLLWKWHGIIGDKGERVRTSEKEMFNARFFPDAKINFAENLLTHPDESGAVCAFSEDGQRTVLSRRELRKKVLQLAGWMRSHGVARGDRVAAYTPNNLEALITMLATAALGAVFSSCSPDFGLNGALDRFGQIQPKILMTCDGYTYSGKTIDRRELVLSLVNGLQSLQAVIVVPYFKNCPILDEIPESFKFETAITLEKPIEDFVRVGFNDPLYILYSSGTTGAPKCIVHGVGGTLIQHIKEHRLHTDLKSGDAMFYFTTCGWMMWNWLVSALAVRVKLILYDGNPMFPGPQRLWKMAEKEKISVFGISAKYIETLRNSQFVPRKDCNLRNLRTILSTGSPLSPEGFEFVYQNIKSDVQLCSISGGTDIVSCFALGCPTANIYAGEIQTRGLGMKTEVIDEAGKSVYNVQGELCCTSPFPSMPVYFWNDPGKKKYWSAYFDFFPGIWRHGDWATMTEEGSVIIHGRSDATLNPGGVRIGTAEIYRQVELFDEILEAIVVGQNWEGDVRVVLFVKLAPEAFLDKKMKRKIKDTIKREVSPRHVPAVIIQVNDIPRTKSGKITELAVSDIIHGRKIKNTEALANAEALQLFKNLPELSQ